MDEKGPGHRGEDGVARDHHARAIAPEQSQGACAYDRTLALEAEEVFEGMAGFALKGLNRLDGGTLDALINEAASLGISSERADRLIGRICRRLGCAA